MDLLSVKIPKALQNRLEAAAKKRKASKSAIVREALEKHLNENGGKVCASGLDRIRDLVGCLEGPDDLATNKKYFKGFGR